MHRGLLLWILLGMALPLACAAPHPLAPDPSTPQAVGDSAMKATVASKAVWGLWQIEIDIQTWKADIIPLRGAQYTVDVVTFLQAPSGNPANMQIKVTDVSDWMSQGLIGVEVGLTHPFPGFAKFTGFDVMGVFIAPGTLAGTYDQDAIRTNGITEPALQNPDGYTRWMNPTEFPSNGTIFRFKTGKMGNPNVTLFTSTINGFKYFVDGLSKDGSLEDFYSSASSVNGRGTFQAGSTNWRKYDLKFPIQGGVPQLIFQYAVVADWIEPDPSLSGDPTKIDVPGGGRGPEGGPFAPQPVKDQKTRRKYHLLLDTR